MDTTETVVPRQRQFERQVIKTQEWTRQGEHLAISGLLSMTRAEKFRSKISPETQQEIRLTQLPEDAEGKTRLVANAENLALFMEAGGVAFSIAQQGERISPGR